MKYPHGSNDMPQETRKCSTKIHTETQKTFNNQRNPEQKK